MNGLINENCSKCGQKLAHNSFMYNGVRHCHCYNCGKYEEEGSHLEKKQYWVRVNNLNIELFNEEQEDIKKNLEKDNPQACPHCGSFLIYHRFSMHSGINYYCKHCEKEIE